MIEDKKRELEEEEINREVFLPTPLEENAVFDPPDGYKGYFPPSAIAAYGCVNCQWRGTNQCPYKFEKGDIKKRKHPIWTSLTFPENVKVDGICKYKKNYLILLSGEWENRPSFDTWQSRLMKNKGVIQNSRDEVKYLKIAKELELKEEEYKKLSRVDTDYMSDEDKVQHDKLIKSMYKELIMLKSDYQDYRSNFVQTWSMLEGFFEKGVDRETAKKIDMNINKQSIPHNQILDIMRGNSVDADYEVIDEKED